ADDLQLVDRIRGGGGIELHGQALAFKTAASVRSARVSLNSLSCVGRAASSNRAATALAPWGIAASAASTRHGLWATPPSATRPVPSFCTIAATETSANA